MKNSIIQKGILLILFLLSLIAKISAQSEAEIEFINATHDFDTIKQKSVAKYCFEFTNVGNYSEGNEKHVLRIKGFVVE